MSQYQAIDLTLSAWAMTNSVWWFSEYQDTEVRTFVLKPELGDRVQVSVDPPRDGRTVVRIGQLRKGLSRLSRREEYSTPLADLSSTLDAVLKVANEWLAEGEQHR